MALTRATSKQVTHKGASNGNVVQNIHTVIEGTNTRLSTVEYGVTALDTKLDRIVSVKDFGAVGDGTTNDTTAFQNAINALAATGGVIRVPPGTYFLNSQVTFSGAAGAITVEGDGWSDFSGVFGSSPATRGGGSWIKWSNASVSPFLVDRGSNGVRFRNIAFFEVHPTIAPGWAPTAYQPFFMVLADGFELDHVMFFGVNKGVQVGNLTYATGRCSFNHVWGEFFTYGIDVVFTADVLRINNYHQYPFWSAYTPNVRAYCLANTKGIILQRNDNTNLHDIFFFGINLGVHLITNALGSTGKLSVSSMDCDSTVTGIWLDYNQVAANDYLSMVLTNFRYQHPYTDTALIGRGIRVLGNNHTIQLCNIDIARPTAEAIYIQGSNNNVGIVNFQSAYWDSNNSGAYDCISSTSSSNNIRLGGFVNFGARGTSAKGLGGSLSSFNWPMFKGGYTVATTDGSGYIVVTHNSGFTPNYVHLTPTEQWTYGYVVTNIAANTFTVRVFRSEVSGTPAASVTAQFYYTLSM